MDPRIALAGFAVGVLVGLTGMGGGSLTTPFLILFAQVRPVLAVGTDLVYSAATKWLGAAVHLRQKTVDLRLAGLLALGSVPASLLGVRLVHALGPAADRMVAKALGAALILVAAFLVFGKRLGRRLHLQDETTGAAPPTVLAAVVLGAAVGFLVGITSVGSGTLVVAGLLVLFPHLPLARLVGTDVLQAALLTSASGIAYLSLGQVDLPLAGSLLAGSLPGVLVGSRLAARAPERVLRPLLALVLAVAGVRLL